MSDRPLLATALLLVGWAAAARADCPPASGDPRWNDSGGLVQYGEVVLAPGGSLFYVGGVDALRLVQLSGSGVPTVTGQLLTAGTQPFLALADPHLYASDQQLGITLFDVGTPSAPTCEWSLDPGCEPARLTVAGGLLLAACDTGMAVLERDGSVTGSTDPLGLLALAPFGDAGGSAVAYRPGAPPVAWLGTTGGGIAPFDLSDPQNPVALATIAGPDDLLQVYDLVQVADRLVATGVLADGTTPEVVVYNVASPTAPTRQGAVALTLQGQGLLGLDLHVPALGQWGYVASIGGLWYLRVNPTGNPSLGLVPSGQPAWTLARSGTRILTSGPTGLDAYNETGAVPPITYNHTGAVDTSGRLAQQVAVVDRVALAWLTSLSDLVNPDGARLQALDASRPDAVLAPIAGGSLSIPAFGLVELALDGRRGYLRAADALVAVDLADPAAPTSTSVAAPALTGATMPAHARAGLLLVGGAVDVGGVSQPRLEVWTTSGAQPALAGALDLAAAAEALQLLPRSVGACLLADGSVLLVDLAAPGLPTVIGTLPLGPTDDPVGLAHSGRQLLLQTAADLQLWDLSVPSSPQRLATLPVADLSTGRLTVSGAVVLAPLGANGFAAFELGAAPLLAAAGRSDTDGATTQVAVGLDRLVVCDGDGYVARLPRPLLPWAGDGSGDGLVTSADLAPVTQELFDADPPWVDAVALAGPRVLRSADVDGSDVVDAGDLAALVWMLHS